MPGDAVRMKPGDAVRMKLHVSPPVAHARRWVRNGLRDMQRCAKLKPGLTDIYVQARTFVCVGTLDDAICQRPKHTVAAFADSDRKKSRLLLDDTQEFLVVNWRWRLSMPTQDRCQIYRVDNETRIDIANFHVPFTVSCSQQALEDAVLSNLADDTFAADRAVHYVVEDRKVCVERCIAWRPLWPLCKWLCTAVPWLKQRLFRWDVIANYMVIVYHILSHANTVRTAAAARDELHRDMVAAACSPARHLQTLDVHTLRDMMHDMHDLDLKVAETAPAGQQ